MSASSCIRCGTPRVAGAECPHCGVIYARAERWAAEHESRPADDAVADEAPHALEPSPSRPSAAALFALDQKLSEARSEVWLAQFAVPIALIGSWLFVQIGLGKFVARTFAGMWLHELGHATVAWMCGYPAFPGPWLTTIGERSLLFAGLVTVGVGYLAWRGWTAENRVLVGVAGVLLFLQLLGTFALSPGSADTLITFAGDAGSLVYGIALVATFFVPPEHKLHRDWLRWGFLVIGAFGFTDTFYDWRMARTDYDAIAFGQFDHGGATDPTKLTEDAGWTIPTMVNRYLALGTFAFLCLIPLQYFHIVRTRAKLEELEETASAARRNRR